MHLHLNEVFHTNSTSNDLIFQIHSAPAMYFIYTINLGFINELDDKRGGGWIQVVKIKEVSSHSIPRTPNTHIQSRMYFFNIKHEAMCMRFSNPG